MHGGMPTRGRGREPVTSAPPGATDRSAISAQRSRRHRSRRLIALAALAAGGLLACAPAALADTVVTKESGNFGVASGDFVHVRDAPSFIIDTRIHVDVVRDEVENEIVVTDAVGGVRLGNDPVTQRECRLAGAEVRCPAAGLEGLKLEGSTENDVITNGTDLTAEILGDGGNDRLRGGTNRDQMNGQAGNDDLFGGPGADIFRSEPGSDRLDGHDGADTVSYSGASAQVSILMDDEANDGIAGEADRILGVEIAVGSPFADHIADRIAEPKPPVVNVFRGGAGSDLIEGGRGNDVLRGGDAHDKLRGGVDDDRLDGEAGADELDGQAGADDTAVYSARTARVSVTIDGRADDGNAAEDALGTLRDNVLAGTENVEGGSAGDFLLGSDRDNRLSGGSGDDTLAGGKGADDFEPGPGTDTVHYQDNNRLLGGVQVTLDNQPNDGSSEDAAADGRRDNVPADTETLIGSGFSDVLEGSDAANRIEGRNGFDTLRGRDGADFLVGEAGGDELDGGDDDDTLRGGAFGDEMVGGAGSDTADYRDHAVSIGADCPVAGCVKVTLDGQANDGTQGQPSENDNVQTENVIGTAGKDDITADANANVLEGLDGDDRLDGRAGPDRFLAGFGNDKVFANDGELDPLIDCGPGTDEATVDDVDKPLDGSPGGALIVNCETVIVEARGKLASVEIPNGS
jgi:Ca2+-binding RTX toxin-like protein